MFSLMEAHSFLFEVQTESIYKCSFRPHTFLLLTATQNLHTVSIFNPKCIKMLGQPRKYKQYITFCTLTALRGRIVAFPLQQ